MKIYWINTALMLVAMSAIGGEMHTWTSSTGTTIEAEFVKDQYGVVLLKTADGSVKKIKTPDLSPEDQALVEKLSNPFAAKAEAAAEPQASEAVKELFGKELRNERDKKVSVDALAGKTIGIYFSAHWCPPCRAFTPELVKFHQEMTRQGKPFEIVFVSSDRGESEMYNYMKELDMPWLALPFGDDHKTDLAKKYSVTGIPMLVIIDADGKLVTATGRGDVSKYGAAAFDRWK